MEFPFGVMEQMQQQMGGQNPLNPLDMGPANPQAPSPMNPAVADQRMGRVKEFLTNYLFALSRGFQGHNSTEAAGMALGAPAEQQHIQQQLQLQQAQTAHVKAQARQLDFQTKQAQESMEVTGPDGARYQIPKAAAPKVIEALIKARSAERATSSKETQAKNAAYLKSLFGGVDLQYDDEGNIVGHKNLDPSALPAPAAATVGLNNARADALKNAPLKNQAITDIGSRRVLINKQTGEVLKELGQAPGYTAGMARAGEFARARAENTPFETFDKDGNVVTTTAAVAIHNGYPAASVWNSVFGPTGATKSQGQAAGAVEAHIDDYKQSIRNLQAKGELGAVQGRLNDYLIRGYGGDDPDIANFVTTTGLMKSGALRAHFGARGGSQILDRFDNMLNTAQEPEALIGSVDAIGSFLRTYKGVGTAHPPATTLGRPAGQDFTVTDPRGVKHSFPNQKQADDYRKAAGIK